LMQCDAKGGAGERCWSADTSGCLLASEPSSSNSPMGVKDAVAVELDSRPRKTLLVIDDVAENRAMLVDLLAPLGFELSEAASGSEALELLP